MAQALGLALSDTELNVLTLAAQGLSVDEIATARGVARETIKTQKKKILAKLGARNTAHAVTIAYRTRLFAL